MNFFTKRVIAAGIDALLIGIPVGIIDFIFGLIRFILGLLPILNHLRFLFSTSFLFLIVYAFYEAIMVYLGRRTIGKMIMGINLQKEDGSRFSFGEALLRGLLKAITLSFWPLGIISLLAGFRNQNSSLPDMILKTSVWED